MMERRLMVAAAKKGEASVLVTVVHAEGSCRRQAGARLLTADAAGTGFTGTIGDERLDADVVRTAAQKVIAGSVVERYATLCDEAIETPYGMSSGGSVDLLFEPARTPEFNALMFAMRASLHGESYTVITWLPGEKQAFARAIIAADGCVEFATEGLSPISVTSALVNGSRWSESTGSILVERLEPPQRLIVIGAGDDAKPLVRMAALIGWNVVVVDGRPQLAQRERFPEAQRVVIAKAADAASLGVSAGDAVVLMPQSYDQDRNWLAELLPVAPLYLGLPGTKHRISLLVGEAAAMTNLSLEDCCERISAPIGLDLNEDGAEAVALTVISEANACCTGKPGTSVRLSALDVSAQVTGSIFPYFMQTQSNMPASQIN